MMSPVPYFMLANKEARKSNQQNLDLAVKSNDKTKDQPTPTKNGNAVGQNVEPDKNITTPTKSPGNIHDLSPCASQECKSKLLTTLKLTDHDSVTFNTKIPIGTQKTQHRSSASQICHLQRFVDQIPIPESKSLSRVCSKRTFVS